MDFTGIETSRLRMRAIAVSDWPAILSYMSDPRVTAFVPEGRLDEGAARTFALKHSSNEGEAVAVIEKASGQMIGHMPFHPWFGPATQEIGWVISSGHQGHGYATEAARALMDFSFRTLRCHRVIATCQPENPASWRIMEKLGMRREAHFRKALHQKNGVWWDEYFYALLADEYQRATP
jgi:[ribosomal protein S5]-alanine N-acetyltransferase